MDKNISIRMDAELHQSLKEKAVKEKTTLKKLLGDAVKKIIGKK